jgi:predicted transcriptional regulator
MHRSRITVDQGILEAAREALREGEALQQFIDLAIRQATDRRQVRADFVRCGLAAGERARQTGQYRSSEEVIAMLEEILNAKSK